MPILPKVIAAKNQAIRVSPVLLETAAEDGDAVLGRLQTSSAGISDEEAERRRQQYGRNMVVPGSHYGHLALLGRAMVNPLVILLLVLATVSFLSEVLHDPDHPEEWDLRAAIVMVLMVVLGVVLRFVQEARADTAAAKLKAMIRVTATVVRAGQEREIPLEDLVPGDVVRLAAGDMIPADLRVLSCKDLHVTQSSLTGEAFPVEKSSARETTAGRPPLELQNLCFLGTSVESWARWRWPSSIKRCKRASTKASADSPG
jgi:P-type Mg2+ transporter